MTTNPPITQAVYSLIRVLFGLYLLAHFAYLFPSAIELFSNQGLLDASLSPLLGIIPNPLNAYDTPFIIYTLLSLAFLSSIAVILGKYDRMASVYLILLLGWLYTRNPLIANPSLPVVGWMLLLHIMLPRGNYGSWESRGKSFVWQKWVFPPQLFFAVWVLLAVAYSYSGYTKLLSPSWMQGDAIRLVLENPLARDYFLREWLLALPSFVLELLNYTVMFVELLFLPLALWRPTRIIVWTVMLLAQFGFLFCFDFADLTLPMLLLHLLSFDRRWLQRFQPQSPAIVFYDGSCAFCSGIVRFSLVEDCDNLLRFSALQGETLKEKNLKMIDKDTIILYTKDQQIFYKSDAVIELAKRLGGIWLILGVILGLIPKFLRDFAYDIIAKIRYFIAGKVQNEACPLLPNAYQAKILP